jgi:hypothetical protein
MWTKSLGPLAIHVTNFVSAIIEEEEEYGLSLIYTNKRGNVDFESTRVLSAMEKYDKIYNKIRIF